jgi:beta-mannosidase
MRNRLFLSFSILFFIFSIGVNAQNPVVLSLNGDWTFSQQGSTKSYAATVPGCVHTDLLANKLIPDPLLACNEQQVQWIENASWIYKKSFSVDEHFLKNQNIFIVAEGLDTYADVFLNGQQILKANNMFVGYEKDVKSLLHTGTNQLEIIFESPVLKGKQEASKISYTLPGDEKVFLRKAQYQFGWDWGPRLVGCGIWKPIYIKAWNEVLITDQHIIQKSLSPEKAELLFETKISATSAVDAQIMITDEISGARYVSKNFKFAKGPNRCTLDFVIDNPKLWWTHDLGVPNVYHFKTEILYKNKILAQSSLQSGLRTIELVKKPDSVGASFYFKLNGIPLYIKGANYIPQDIFPQRTPDSAYENLIESASNANMNMLRVWGGGVYENDVFYNLCDEKGILVWQDFMFACAMYPGDSAYLSNVADEIRYQVKRLRNHPCIALWCGNNEIDEGWHNWGWQQQYHYSISDSTRIWEDYLRLFRKLIPDIIQEEDGSRAYWQSSPQYGWGRSMGYTHGDSHYWGVWWGMDPFEKYREKIGRFASEYGFQGFPEKSTLLYLNNNQEPALKSDVLKCHQKHPTGFETIQTYMDREYKTSDSLDDYIYKSQLLQAYGIKTAIEAHRNAKPRCMGTLYWQLNDCWPVVSWSSMDYFQRPKALQYFVKKAFDRFLITQTPVKKGMEIRVISDSMHNIEGVVSIDLMDFSGKNYYHKQEKITLNANDNKLFMTINPLEYGLDSSQFSKIFLLTTFSMNGKIRSEQFGYFVASKDLILPEPNITYSLKPANNGYFLQIHCDKLTKNIYIYFENLSSSETQLSDNFFDMYAGETREIFVSSKQPEDLLKLNVRIKYLIK